MSQFSFAFRYLISVLIISISVPYFSVSAEALPFECGKGAPFSVAIREELLVKVQSAYQKLSGLEASFTQQSYLAALDSFEISGGVVSFLRPGKMRWEYLNPEKQTFLLTESLMYFYQPSQRQVVVDEVSKVLLSDLPVSFLAGVGDLSKSFTVKEACEGSAGLLIRLQPKKEREDEPLKGFVLLVQKGLYLPLGAEVTDAGGNKTLIVLKNLKIDPSFPLDLFKFSYPEGVDIIDKRVN